MDWEKMNPRCLREQEIGRSRMRLIELIKDLKQNPDKAKEIKRLLQISDD